MIYERQTDLILALRGAGLTYRDVANRLQVSPGTISARLNGYMSISSETRKAIHTLIAEMKARRDKTGVVV